MKVSPQPDPEQEALNRLILEKLAPIPVNPERRQSMRLNLINMANASAAKQAAFLTQRSKDGLWKNLTKGIRVKQLWSGSEGNSVLIEFGPGASLVPHRHHWLEEGIVLNGDLHIGDTVLRPLDYHVSPPGSRHAAIQSQRGALAYLRGTSLGHTGSVLTEVLGGVLPGTDLSQNIYAHSDQDWQQVATGIEKKILWHDDKRVSCFYRLQPGAEIAAHLHPLEEECLVLAGEVFLNDSLLRSGDYQLAPAGTQHDQVYTDVGAVLFIRSGIGDF